MDFLMANRTKLSVAQKRKLRRQQNDTMDRPQTQTRSYGYYSPIGSIMQNRSFANNSTRPANPKSQGKKPFDDSPFFDRRNEGSSSRSHRDDHQDFRESDRGFFDSDRSYRNGNSAQAERIRDERSQNYNNVRLEHIDSRRTHSRSSSPILKETMVMLQDDPRSVYGKYSYTIPKAQPVCNINYNPAKQPRGNVKPPVRRGQKFKSRKRYYKPPTSSKQKWMTQTPNIANVETRKRKQPPPTNDPAKKLKIHTDEGIQMAIVAVGTTISESQVEIIQNHLLDKIDAIPEGGISPGFTNLKHNARHLELSCSNQMSRDWLEAEMNGCVLWNDVKLKVVEAKEVAEPMNVKVWVPGPRITREKLFHRLTVQNTGLDTSSWHVTFENPGNGGVTFYIDLNKESWQRIMELDRRPHLNFTRVNFKAIGQWSIYNFTPLDGSSASEASSSATTQQETADTIVESAVVAESSENASRAETGGLAEAVETAGTADIEETDGTTADIEGNDNPTADIEGNVGTAEVADSADADDSEEGIKIEDFEEILEAADDFLPIDGHDNKVDEPTMVTVAKNCEIEN